MKTIKKQRQEEHTIASRQEDVAAFSLAALQVQLDATSDGLSTAEAACRLTRYGYNELPEKRMSPIVRLLSTFWGPILRSRLFSPSWCATGPTLASSWPCSW